MKAFLVTLAIAISTTSIGTAQTRVVIGKVYGHILYRFEPIYNGVYHFCKTSDTSNCFGIVNSTVVNSQCDKFTFEFAGYWYGEEGPLYFVKRSDGLYLSGGLGIGFRRKIPGQREFQVWLVNPVRGQLNTYNFMLPYHSNLFLGIRKAGNNGRFGFSDWRDNGRNYNVDFYLGMEAGPAVLPNTQ